MSPSPRHIPGGPASQGTEPGTEPTAARPTPGSSDAGVHVTASPFAPAERAAITSLSSMATRALLDDLTHAFAEATGQRVALESVGGVEAARRVAQGDAFDVVILARDAIAKLAASGHLIGATHVDFARSRLAAAVRTGRARPHLETVAAVRDALSSAKSVGYSTGPSGVALAALFHGWGLTETLRDRTVVAPPGVPVGTLVARGDVDIGFQQLSELIDVAGIEVVQDLAPELEVVTTFSAALGVHSAAGEGARAWLAFLSSPLAKTAMRRHGMEPA